MVATPGRGWKRRRWGVALLVGGVLLVGCFAAWALAPRGRFTLATGLFCPATAKLIDAGDDYGGFPANGEWYVIATCDPGTIRHWLGCSPLWGQSQWQPGPVPPEIGHHCRFRRSEFMACSFLPDGSRQYSGGPAEVREMLSSPRVWYAARNRCPSSALPYHSGELLVVDPERGEFWYSHWHY